MPFLSRSAIEPRLCEIFGATFVHEGLDEAAYNMRLGGEIFVSTKETPEILSESSPTVAIHPGEFALLMTHECVKVPKDLIGLITLRHRYKKQGLLNVSGFHVDPGFEGRLFYSVFNVGPNDIILRHLEDMFMIFFARIEPQLVERKTHDHDGQESFSMQDMLAIRGPSRSLVDMDKRIRELESNIRFYSAIVTGALLALLALVARLVIK